MYKLPFIIPEEDLELNLALLLMIIDNLSSTSTGIMILNNERLLLYFYLVKNPHNLNKLLISLSKKNIKLKSYELLSYKAEKHNTEILYDTSILKKYLQILLSKELIQISYNDKVGFLYQSTEREIKQIDNNYFNRVLIFINKLKQTISIPTSKINTNLKHILNEAN